MEIESKQQIIERRKEIEQDILEMLKETKSDFRLKDVLAAIYNEEDNDDMMKAVAMFDRGGDASELDNVLELVSDAWNYFPHKILDGLSPAEKILRQEHIQFLKRAILVIAIGGETVTGGETLGETATAALSAGQSAGLLGTLGGLVGKIWNSGFGKFILLLLLLILILLVIIWIYKKLRKKKES